MAAESHYEEAVDMLAEAQTGSADPVAIAQVHATLELTNAVLKVESQLADMKGIVASLRR